MDLPSWVPVPPSREMLCPAPAAPGALIAASSHSNLFQPRETRFSFSLVTPNNLPFSLFILLLFIIFFFNLQHFYICCCSSRVPLSLLGSCRFNPTCGAPPAIPCSLHVGIHPVSVLGIFGRGFLRGFWWGVSSQQDLGNSGCHQTGWEKAGTGKSR